MSEIRVTKRTIKNNKKVSKDKTPIALRLVDDETVLAKSIYKSLQEPLISMI